MVSLSEHLPPKAHVLRIRMTSNELKYVEEVGKALEIYRSTNPPQVNISETVRWLIHQTVLFNYLGKEDLKRARERFVSNMRIIQ
jgi:hypothetical protein